MADMVARGGIQGYLERKWQGQLTDLAENPAIGVAAEELLGGDPERVSILVMNLSANVLYVAPRTGVSAVNGVRLNANGGSMSLNADDDGALVGAPWYAIATGAGSQVYVLVQRRSTAISAQA